MLSNTSSHRLRIVSLRPKGRGIILDHDVFVMPALTLLPATNYQIDQLEALVLKYPDVVVLTSVESVRQALPVLRLLNKSSTKIMAVGITTKRLLESHGFYEVWTIEGGFGLRALMEAYHPRQSESWLIIGGPLSHASKAAIQSIEKARGKASYAQVYDRQIHETVPEAFYKDFAPNGIDLVLAFCQASLDVWSKMAEREHPLLYDVNLLVCSERLKQQAIDKGFASHAIWQTTPDDLSVETWFKTCYNLRLSRRVFIHG